MGQDCACMRWAGSTETTPLWRALGHQLGRLSLPRMVRADGPPPGCCWAAGGFLYLCPVATQYPRYLEWGRDRGRDRGSPRQLTKSGWPPTEGPEVCQRRKNEAAVVCGKLLLSLPR